jgi:hypothetical protein
MAASLEWVNADIAVSGNIASNARPTVEPGRIA